MYRFVPMISAEEISLPKDRRCLRFKCNSFYELNAVNTLRVHDLSAVNDCILRFKYSSTALFQRAVIDVRPNASTHRFTRFFAEEQPRTVMTRFTLPLRSPVVCKLCE